MAPRSRPPSRPAPAGTGDGAAARPAARPSRRSGRTRPGTSTVSRVGSRRRRHWATEATNSLVPTHAASASAATSTTEAPRQPRRRGARAAPGCPPTPGSPARCPTPPAPRARRAGGGSHGRADRAVDHPALVAPASLARSRSRSYGYGGEPEARHDAATNSANRARPASSSTTCSVAASSPSLLADHLALPVHGGQHVARGPRARRAATTRSRPAQAVGRRRGAARRCPRRSAPRSTTAPSWRGHEPGRLGRERRPC